MDASDFQANRPQSIRPLRLASLADGLSYLLLLGIAMPLKYLAGMPLAVRIVGSLHGLLYLIFIVLLIRASWRKDITPALAIALFIAALIPAAPFFMDRFLREPPQSG